MKNMSFRGEDTRDAFTSHLHAALRRKQIETYIDNKLEKGDDIGPALLEAIEKSIIALVIFSKDYASSTWCLKELVHILGCKKSYGQIVIPIFYRIDPSHVRKQQGTYALEDRPLKRIRDEVANWRAALEEAANMSGFHYSSKTGTEADFVEKVAQHVLTKLNRESSSDLKGLVGIEKKIGKIESLLCLGSPGVCCVGIWGMGGIGKTTLADAVFHRHSSKFEVCCFLANVREKSEKMDGLNDLRNTLVRELLKDERVNINTLSIPRHIQDRLRRTKALIVLDDVNARKQLEYLVGDDDRFCQGSRIIITSRDQGLLEQRVDRERIYNVEGLCSDEGLELFHSHAFGNKSPTTDYTELSREVVDYIKGIPLALKVMGSSFRRCKSKQEWEDQWKKVKEFPDEEINQVLRISYDGLGKHEKAIFLDIACFHKGYERNYVKEVLDGSGFRGKKGINDLIDRSLISISYSYDEECIEMHDLVEEMGKAIAQEQGSRLLIAKDVNQLLANNQSDGHVQAISFDWLEMEYANFEKMHQLRWVCVHSYEHLATSLIGSLGLPNSLRCLRWYKYPLKSLPSKFSAQNLVVLEMPYSQVEGQLWNEDQSPVNLKRINLARCSRLTEVPDLSQSLQIEHIDLNSCRSLVEIPSYFQHLGKLTYLDLGRCTNLKNLPEMPCNLEFLDLSSTAIEELPSSVWSHEKISHLVITSCKHLKSLPSNSCKLKPSLSLEGCESLCEFWELPRDTTELALSSSTIKELRNASIESAVGLTAIKLINCESLVSLPTNIWKLKSLKSLDLQDCSNFQNFPEISEVMEYLEFLNLSGTAVKELPPSIRNLVALRELYLQNCKNLEVFPDELFCITSLQVLNMWGTEIKSLPASIKPGPKRRRLASDLKGLVGIEKKIEEIESLLCLDSPGVCCVGILGMGGIGKTTLADAVFNRLASEFEACCFLKNVRENSEGRDAIYHLRNTLVRDLLKDKDVNINTPFIPRHIQDRLRLTKALIVLDDVNARKQLEYLVGDDYRFCQGSRIIITARDKGLLEQKVDPEKIYNVEGLGSDEGLELFHSHAFENNSPTTDYTEFSREVVDYIKGIPLALKVMGSSFRRCKSKQEWEDQWKKVREFPDEEINQVLRISYDGLGKHEKEIFLDIACFHKGNERNYVKEVLDGSGFHGEAGINDLIDRSLISISYSYDKAWIEMHDLVEEMGKAIAQEQGSRLLKAKDVNQLLANNQSDGHVQAISFDWLEMEYANFEKMHQLRWLCVHSYEHLATSLIGSLGLPNSLRYLYWGNYPLKSLPSKFSAQNLVVLEMPYSQVEGQLWNEDQSPVNLKRINLARCNRLTEVPDLSQSLKIEHIDLNSCRSLVEIPSYFQHLGKLTYLDLGRCTNLKNLPEMPCNLEFLDLSLTAIEELPSSVWSQEKISHLDITSCKHLKSLPSNTCKLKPSLSLEGCESLCEFWELPRDTTELALSSSTIKELRNASIESAVGLTAIKLINCESLVSLPTNIWKLKSLRSLDLQDCSNFQNFPEISKPMEHLEFLDLSRTAVKELPPSIGNLVALRELELQYCKNLEVVPDELFCLTSLQVLDLSCSKIKSLPASIKQAAQLSHLFLHSCKSLESLPELPPLLQHLEAEGCTSLKTVSSSSTALAQGWEKYKFSRGLHEQHIFFECPELDENARSNIMADAQLRIMRMATASSKFKEDKIEKTSYNSNEGSSVGIRCCGNEIPKWFSHKSEGCSIKIELPRDWFSTDFLGFALSLVVVFASDFPIIGCKYNFKTSNGESHEVNHPRCNPFMIGSSGDSPEVLVWWYSSAFEEVVEGAQSPTAFYKLVTEVNVDFTIRGRYYYGFSEQELEVKKCGICLLYGKDAEMIKQRAL
ncbi:unnamed protein product [Prunus armeniaca]